LREFQDNEKTIPTILTTSQKLSTGVDARNIRNIILLRAVENIIEFKQIIGRGTRLFDGKFFFTIYDFVGATKKFRDPEWDGEPEDPELCDICNKYPCECEKQPPKECPRCGKIPCVCLVDPPQVCEKCGEYPCVCKKMVKIKLKDGRELEIQHTVESTFWGPDGEQLSVEEFLNLLYGRLPEFFSTEEELRKLWSVPSTRNALLTELEENGINNEDLKALQTIINAENSDLFDVLEFIAFHKKPISRETRVKVAEAKMYYGLNDEQIEFVEFVISKYLETGVDELSQDKLSTLLELKYKAIGNAHTKLGETKSIINLFIDFQKHLYDNTITSKVV
jgi:type I restriction enzyme R subunit